MVRRENILLHMTVEERLYMRKIVVALEGKVVKSELPQRKREALVAYRAQANKHCEHCINEIAVQEAEKNAKSPVYHEPPVAPRKKVVKLGRDES